MVKGISRQVIVVEAQAPKLFEQAIFILRRDAKGVTDEELMKEAKYLIGTQPVRKWQDGIVWASCGGALVGALWLLSALL